VHPGFVTVHTRVDKGAYWVLCREAFKPKHPMPVNKSAYKRWLGAHENRQWWHLYQLEIDETRHLLNATF
jgi:hypothetical protein